MDSNVKIKTEPEENEENDQNYLEPEHFPSMKEEPGSSSGPGSDSDADSESAVSFNSEEESAYDEEQQYKSTHGSRRRRIPAYQNTVNSGLKITSNLKNMRKVAPALDPNEYKCSACPKAFSRKHSLTRHTVTQHALDRPLTCDLCPKSFVNEYTLKAHKKTHRDHSPAKFKCDICLKYFTAQYLLERHKLIHSGEKPFKCHLCPMAFTQKQYLKIHIEKHNKGEESSKTFMCHICPRTYFQKRSLERHIDKCHIPDHEKPFKCHVCSKSFVDNLSLEKHLKFHDEPSRLRCDVCSRAFKEKRAIENHLVAVHSRCYLCDKCYMSFETQDDFEVHSRLAKEDPLDMDSVPYKCHICGETFRSQCNLNVHTDSHLKEAEPPMKVQTERQQDQHQGDSTELNDNKKEKDEYKCEICGHMFDKEAYLDSHIRILHKNVQWKCGLCVKLFATRFKRKKHMMMHYVELRPYKCSICNNSFVSLRDFQRHESSHERQPYECNECQRSYAREYQYGRHMAMKHGAKKYQAVKPSQPKSYDSHVL